MEEIETFVRLKYEILTADISTWKKCEATYPAEVKSKWAWRCAADVEDLAGRRFDARECIRISKLYRDGEATLEELREVFNNVDQYEQDDESYPYSAAEASFNAAIGDIYSTADSACYAHWSNECWTDGTLKEQWNIYLGWLIEELCEYENNKGEL